MGEEVLLNTGTWHVQGVGATDKSDFALVLPEGRMIDVAEVVAMESDHHYLKSWNPHRDRAAAELGQPHRVFVRVEQAKMKVPPGHAAIEREVGG